MCNPIDIFSILGRRRAALSEFITFPAAAAQSKHFLYTSVTYSALSPIAIVYTWRFRQTGGHYRNALVETTRTSPQVAKERGKNEHDIVTTLCEDGRLPLVFDQRLDADLQPER